MCIYQLVYVIYDQSGLFTKTKKSKNFLLIFSFNPNLGGLFRGSFKGEEERYKITTCLKLVRIMLKLEIWHVSTNTYVVSENIPFSTKAVLILLMSIFFAQNSTFTQSNSERAALEVF